MRFIYCILYLILSGLTIFFLGRAIPRKWIKEDKFPFRLFKFEKNGLIYEKLRIKVWKTKLPDASVIISKIVPNFMPTKRIEKNNKEKVKILIKETCVAESNHFLSAISGLLCIKIWKGIGGWIISLIYFIWNIPFILIQRYNRPRLISVYNKSQKSR